MVPEPPMQRLLAKKVGNHGVATQDGRLLIKVNVLGSAGPIRFIVSEGDLVCSVIATALRSYSRQGCLPVLGSNLHEFILYFGPDALSPMEPIGLQGSRNLLHCKEHSASAEGKLTMSQQLSKKRVWKSWLDKSLSFKISSH